MRWCRRGAVGSSWEWQGRVNHMSPDEYRYCPSCGGRLRFQAIEHEPVEHPVCESCGHIVYLDPKVAAGIIPVTDEGILLLRRAIGPSRGLWVFPGGYVNRGEHVRGAAERETREEVGLRPPARYGS